MKQRSVLILDLTILLRPPCPSLPPAELPRRLCCWNRRCHPPQLCQPHPRGQPRDPRCQPEPEPEPEPELELELEPGQSAPLQRWSARARPRGVPPPRPRCPTAHPRPAAKTPATRAAPPPRLPSRSAAPPLPALPPGQDRAPLVAWAVHAACCRLRPGAGGFGLRPGTRAAAATCESGEGTPPAPTARGPSTRAQRASLSPQPRCDTPRATWRRPARVECTAPRQPQTRRRCEGSSSCCSGWRRRFWAVRR